MSKLLTMAVLEENSHEEGHSFLCDGGSKLVVHLFDVIVQVRTLSAADIVR